MRQKVFILWATGNVWTELVRQICRDDGPEKNANPTDIVGIASSKKAVFKPEGFPQNFFPEILKTETMSEFLEKAGMPYDDLSELLAILKNIRFPKNGIIIDVTPAKGESIRQFHLDALGAVYNYSIVTANKNIVGAESQKVFEKVTASHGLYDYNTSVMAGSGVAEYIKSATDIHDDVLSIEWCFSGTLGYITSGLEEGKAFSQIVTEAYEKKYTEPNPYDDLSGLDVARKLVILCRTASNKLELADVKVRWLVSETYNTAKNAQEFLEAIRAEDAAFAKLFETAKNKGKTLRYVGSMKKEKNKLVLEVGLQEVDILSNLGQLKGTLNGVKVTTKSRTWYNESQGAWVGVTASSIRVAIAHMIPHGLPRI